MNRPTIKQCFEYSNNMEQSTLFFHHFEAIDWMMGKRGNAKPMKNWRSALTNWIKRSKPTQTKIEKAVSNTNTAVIDRLWVRMTQIYGSKWTSNYGTEPTKPWIDTFNSMSTGKIKAGLNVLMKSGEAWPPSLIEFIGYCQCYKERLTPLPAPLQEKILAQRQATRQARESAMNKINNLL